MSGCPLEKLENETNKLENLYARKTIYTRMPIEVIPNYLYLFDIAVFGWNTSG